MEVTITFESYSDICNSFMYGKKILELPERIVNAIDNYFDGKTIDVAGAYNPDVFYTKHLYQSTLRETLVNDLRFLNQDEFSDLLETGKLENYVIEHLDHIVDALNDKYYYLGLAGSTFYTIR
ncbi:TPA: hypothetical protein U1B40_001360 [Streptococcus suis]|uniref:hypothetical protein n=1 Tax=Streptococcus suis TaxID=1307 RepID=UPI000423BDAD|nr:hypothetical protein [Streptococcus suis]MBL6440632.1 hypothetical protein [Streptococcus suis]MBM7138558.1 hypothetical protein [Streptococcus suis]MBY4601639.1 hypothetical protein [Streptococcus suis]MCO8173369.1 hypothetical protein [Streptococcus suis]MCO8181753.1 hypothetical protein [Streptococcus suis]